MQKRKIKISLYLKVFNKYFLTKRVKIILFLFAMISAAFYFFTDINLAVSMFFAFVVVGLIVIPSMNADDFRDKFESLRKEYPTIFSPIYSDIEGNIYYEDK